jgi:hypothetical protein
VARARRARGGRRVANDAATAAKHDFLTAYNALRSTRGLSAVPDDF